MQCKWQVAGRLRELFFIGKGPCVTSVTAIMDCVICHWSHKNILHPSDVTFCEFN